MMSANSGQTVSRHFASLLRRRIVSGRLVPGARMPDEADLSRDYGLAPRSVRQALRDLEQEGILVHRDGQGLYVRETPT
jgi:DNA-binding GntR family transcriptional regulator